MTWPLRAGQWKAAAAGRDVMKTGSDVVMMIVVMMMMMMMVMMEMMVMMKTT